MSISDKLTAVAENMQKVYNAGWEAGGSYYDTFWDSFQQNGERTRYDSAFSGISCPMSIDAFKPKYSMNVTNSANMFRTAAFEGADEPVDLVELFEQLGIVLDTSKNSENFSMMFYGANIRRVGVIDCTSITALAYIFYNATKLETVDKWIVTEKITEYSNAFGGAKLLKNITVEGTIARSVSFNESPLSKASIISVMDALSDTASGQTLTLKRTAVNTAFETSAGLVNGSTSDEWLNLIATKPNWSIVLS